MDDPRAWLHPAAHHPGAASGCGRCAATGWCLAPTGGTLRAVACGCVGPCPTCGGSGFLHGGLKVCRCRVAGERIALLAAAGLPVPLGADPASPALAAWFATYRPEVGRRWLLACGAVDGAVVRALAWLVTGIGVPVDVLVPGAPAAGWARWRRIVACFDLGALGPERAGRLVDHCAREGLTLVATADIAPFPPTGPGLETRIGERVAVALFEHGEVVVVGG